MYHVPPDKVQQTTLYVKNITRMRKKVHTAEKKNTAYKSPDRTEEQPGKPPLTFEEMREREKTRVPPYFRSNF